MMQEKSSGSQALQWQVYSSLLQTLYSKVSLRPEQLETQCYFSGDLPHGIPAGYIRKYIYFYF